MANKTKSKIDGYVSLSEVMDEVRGVCVVPFRDIYDAVSPETMKKAPLNPTGLYFESSTEPFIDFEKNTYFVSTFAGMVAVTTPEQLLSDSVTYVQAVSKEPPHRVKRLRLSPSVKKLLKTTSSVNHAVIDEIYHSIIDYAAHLMANPSKSIWVDDNSKRGQEKTFGVSIKNAESLIYDFISGDEFALYKFRRSTWQLIIEKGVDIRALEYYRRLFEIKEDREEGIDGTAEQYYNVSDWPNY